MAQLSKLEELLSSGIGSKVEIPTNTKTRTIQSQQLTAKLGTVAEMGDNLFLAVNGRMTEAHKAGLIDVMVIECLGFGKDVKSTPSGRFADTEYPAAASSTYNAILDYAKTVRGDRSVAGTLVGTSILRPVSSASDKVPALLAYSFFSYGSRGGRDMVSVGGKSFPRTQFNLRIVRTAIAGLCHQLRSGSYKESYPTDRKIRIGLPRILGGIGGIMLADLLDHLVPITAEYPEFEFYVFSNSQPDDAVVVGVEPPKSNRRKSNARGKKKVSQVPAERR